jgi:hypothetical protein
MAACPRGRLAARGCVGMVPAYAGLRADRKLFVLTMDRSRML